MIEKPNYKKLTVHLTDGSTIKGQVNIKKYNRISDFLNMVIEDSLIIKEATLAGHSGKVVVINKAQIVWIVPED
jgi:small nuclear ribonucleoprotein (snRNP)-like protein